ncbi:glycosyl hydrolase family 8 [Sagittula stellata]|uniref:cellulase n=1 Tax=Sagittula stellata (strain ATCC 700073 / DSM 11524 / E-37) TaxID=388399 RepID=A3K4W8_SAGS3|nr:Endoglucanase Y [Sagittula stellata E-37]
MGNIRSRSGYAIVAFSVSAAWTTLAADVAAGPTLPVAPEDASVIYPSVDKDHRRAVLDRFWREWKRVYLHQGCGGAYVDIAGDGKPTYGDSVPNTLTVSEAHGYGMLALVRMAGRDTQAKPLFDEMLAYFRLHPAESGPGLMAWNQTRDCKDAPDGEMTASDGDIDIALALQMAERVWGGYAEDAAEVREAVLSREITRHDLVKLGDWASYDVYAEASRSSDFTPFNFFAFADAPGGDATRWTDIRNTGYAVWGQISETYAPDTGLVPDFMVGMPNDPRPAPAEFLEGEYDGFYSWNALRYPYRLAADFRVSGDPRAAERLRRINKWIRAATNGEPSRIASTYQLDGSIPQDGRWTGEPGWISMFTAGAIAGSGDPTADQAWMDSLWAAMVSIPIEEGDYFGNTLKLLAMIDLAEM